MIIYNAGEGDDIIEGFKANSTLQIDGGSGGYSTQKSGNDIIVWVDNNKITLKGAANLSKLNIKGSFPINITGNYDNSRNHVMIAGNNSANNIRNSADNVTIQANGGNDTIYNIGSNVTIDAGDGNDSIKNNGHTVSVDAGNVVFEYNLGDGDDVIYGFRANSTLDISGANYATERNSNDIIVYIGDGSAVTLKDTVKLSGINIRGVEDKSKNLSNNKDNVSMVGSNYADTLTNSGKNVMIMGNAGNDTVKNTSSEVSIDGGKGNDTILNQSGTAASILGVDGNDLIGIKGALQNTILAGRGDDTINVDWSSNNALIIYRAGDGTTINPGDGNDLIEGFNTNSTLQIGETARETYATQVSGDDVIVTVADSKITIKGGAKLPKLNIDGLSKRIINNSDSKVELLGGDLNDSIVNTGFEVTMKGFGGNDTIQNYTRENTIDAGAGNDSIVNRGGFRSTITGGKGNDSIDVLRSDEVLIKYRAGDGDDYIEGFNESSSLSITGGVYSTTENNHDIIVTVNENKITLKGAASVSPLNSHGI